MNRHATFFRNLLCFAVVLACNSWLAAQDRDPTPQRGFHPAVSYSLGEIETINTAGGDLILNIPIASLPPGRAGFKAGLNLIYNSKPYDVVWDFSKGGRLTNNLRMSTDGSWNFGHSYRLDLETRPNPTGSWPCDSDPAHKRIYKLKISFPDGSQHLLRPLDVQGVDFEDVGGDGYYDVSPGGLRHDPCGNPPPVLTTMTYYSMDSSFLRLDISHDDTPSEWWNNPWALYFPDGRKVTGGNAPQTIYDANGNYVRIQKFTYNGHPATQIIDEHNRHILVEENCSGSQTCIYAPAAGAWEVLWYVNWGQVSVTKDYLCTDDAQSCVLSVSLPVVTQVQLPAEAGSLSYSFLYSGGDRTSGGYGEVRYLTLPSGASANYAWYRDNSNGIRWDEVLENYVSTKTLSWTDESDGSPVSETTSFLLSQTRADVTGPDGGTTISFFNPKNGNQPGLVYRIEHTDDTVVERIWADNIPFGANVSPTNNPFIKTEFRSLADNNGNLVKTSARGFTYDKNGNVTRVDEYDWMAHGVITRDGAGKAIGFAPDNTKLKRVTTTAYYYPTPDSSSGADDPDVYHKGTSPPRKNAAASVEVQAAGTIQSRTEFTYDDASSRGNLTLERKWDSTKGALPLTDSNSVRVSHQYL